MAPLAPALSTHPVEAASIGVTLGHDWLARWLSQMGELELKTYLQLAHAAQGKPSHPEEDLERQFPGWQPEEVQDGLQRLEGLGLLEVVRQRGQLHYHFPHLCDGVHRADSCRPSLREALEHHRQIVEELRTVALQEETEELRERYFQRYPSLRLQYEVHQANRPTGPRWRLWMELSSFLNATFEDEYGLLMEEHAAVFKELSADHLRLRLAQLEAVVEELLEASLPLIPFSGDGWVALCPEGTFGELPEVAALTERSGIGIRQIYLQLVETLTQRGLTVCLIDDQDQLRDVALGASVGLDEETERLLFLQEGRTGAARVAAAASYAESLMARVGAPLEYFIKEGRVAALPSLVGRLWGRIDQALAAIYLGDARLEAALQLPQLESAFLRRAAELRDDSLT